VGVTLHLLWEEYRQVHEHGYGYSQFCELYRRWASKQALDAAAAPRGREELHRLLRQAAAPRRPTNG
jgi:hypothetical protein